MWLGVHKKSTSDKKTAQTYDEPMLISNYWNDRTKKPNVLELGLEDELIVIATGDE